MKYTKRFTLTFTDIVHNKGNVDGKAFVNTLQINVKHSVQREYHKSMTFNTLNVEFLMLSKIIVVSNY